MVYANVRDSIIGFADGLTVPFAVTAGLASTGNSRLVILGGLAELVSGSISMGLGAYLAALTDIDRYEAQHRKLLQTEKDLESKNHGIGARKELEEFFCEYGVEKEAVPAIEALLRNSDSRIKFMMEVKHSMERPTLSRACISGIIMGLAYFIGGLLPMIPYFVFQQVNHALFTSIGITVVILLIFGYAKARLVTNRQLACIKSALQTLTMGAIAAGASYGIVTAVNSKLN